MSHVSLAFFVASSFGLLLYATQLVAVLVHRRARQRSPRLRRGISILKPLCGIDDNLDENLECFARLPYEPFELLLGVRDQNDPAYPVAQACARRHPRRVRVILQNGYAGLNPKVNQLCTLARAARYDVVVISDSNVRVAPDYLHEIAAHFEDPAVGLVTHPVAGVDELRLGSLMDNLHLCGSVGAGMIGLKRVVKKDVVVGKSMALLRRDVDALGGFEAVADVLAEDYVLGRMVPQKLGKRVVVARTPVMNVSRRRAARDFYQRYRRWSVMHRQAIGPRLYAAELLLNPTMIAAGGALVHPSFVTLSSFGVVAALKLAYDGSALKLMRGGPVPLLTLFASPAKDALLACAWASGLVRRQIEWRGNRLRVLPGTRLAAAHEAQSTPLSEAA
jgi:ceramide glucosyltransferase